jgi:hypothetical protein
MEILYTEAEISRVMALNLNPGERNKRIFLYGNKKLLKRGVP